MNAAVVVNYMNDCLTIDEHETWEMHGLNFIKQANNTSSTWNKFMAAIKILNVENHEDFIQHLMYLQEEPDQNYVYTLLRIYQDNLEKKLIEQFKEQS